MALGTTYHPWCLVCSHCGEQLTKTVHKSPEGKLYCERDFVALCAFTCARCGKTIEDDSLGALDKHWHPACFTCFGEGCTVNLGDGDASFHEVDGKPYCRTHFSELRGERCSHCGRGIFPGEQLTVMGRPWHRDCLQCFVCHRTLTVEDKIYPRADQPHCEECFLAGADKCVACGKAILGKYLTVLNRKYHATGCLGCVACRKTFDAGEKMYQRDSWPVCLEHARGELSEEARARMAAHPTTPAAAPPAAAAGGGGAAPPPPPPPG